MSLEAFKKTETSEQKEPSAPERVFETGTTEALKAVEYAELEATSRSPELVACSRVGLFQALDTFEARFREILRKWSKDKEPEESPEEDAPIAAGEEFDPREGLALIRYASRSSRPIYASAFREMFTYQKEGVAKLQEKILALLQENPSAPLSELCEVFDELGDKYGLSPEQRSFGRSLLINYAERQVQINQARLKYPDNADLYRHLFCESPKGKVEISVGPGTLFVQCDDPSDYALIYSQKFLEGQPVLEQDITAARTTGGVSIPGALQQEFEGAIIAENRNSHHTPEISNTIRTHEQQHALKRLFGYAYVRTNTIDRLLTSTTPEDDRRIIRSYVEHWRERMAEDRARDEILAYFKDGTSAADTYQYLVKTDGPYNYLEGRKELVADAVERMQEIFKPGNSVPNDAVLKMIDDILGKEYRQVVLKACAIPMILRDNGYTTDQTIALLTQEPLGKWERVAKRLLGDRMPVLKAKSGI